MRERPVGGLARMVAQVRAVPDTTRDVIVAFATEVIGVVTGAGRTMVSLVPGARRGGAAAPRVGTAVTGVGSRDAGRRADTAPPDPEQVRDLARRRQLLRRRLRLAATVAGVVCVVAAWVFVPRSDAFRIRHLEVTGASAVSDLEVRSRIDELLDGRTVFTVDEEAVERSVQELPFVESALVERHLPGGLQVHIREYRPLALAYGDGKFWLVAQDGRILAKARRKEWSGQVPTVTLRGEGLKPGARVASEPALQLLAALPADSILELETVEVEEYRLFGQLAGGVQVRFGRADQLRQKVLVAEKVLREARRKDIDLLYIDVTLPSKPAFCDRTVSGCLLPRADASGTADAADDTDTPIDQSATTPEETGGDALAVVAAT